MSFSDGIPTKPPRSHKTGKETGILMTVIKTLSATASTDNRDREKSKLEKEFKRSDQKLDSHLAANQETLATVMQTFGQACAEISSAKTRLRDVKGNLQKCKHLLHCRREELERLWLEGIEHKHVLEILNQIDKLRNGSDQFTKALNRKQYLPAVEILMNCLDSWNVELEEIEGLKDVHNDLKLKKNKIYETLREELYREIYQKGTTSQVFDKRQGSGVFNPFQRSSSDRRSSGRCRTNLVKARKIYLDVTPSTSTSHKSTLLNGDFDEPDAFLSMTVKCMALLKMLPKFTSDLRHQMEENLLAVVNSASQQVIEYGDTNGSSETDSVLLQELLQVIFQQLRWIVRSHVQLLEHIRNEVESQQHRGEFKIHSEEYVWSKVQIVLQSTLKMYFDVSDSKTNPAAITATRPPGADINSFFLRRKQQRQKNPLFKFEYSMHGLNINDYVCGRQELDGSLVDKHRFLVCKPNPRNIIVVYDPVHNFAAEIEQTIGKKCELRKFMGNNINRAFVQQLYKEVSECVELAKKNPDCWRDVISVEETKALKCSRPLLQSVVQTGRSIQEVINLSKELPSHCDQLINILDALLTNYKEVCHEAYVGIVQPDAEDKGKISATWVKDEDIQRLLKSLPNWTKLQKNKDRQRAESIDESPEDVRTQNIRESDLLSGIFNGKIVLDHEILSDVKQLEQLAHFQESLEWFSDRVTHVANSFERNEGLDPVLKQNVLKFYSISAAFQEMADICLLVLHLEVRVHCFYYLLPMAQRGEFAPGVDNQIPDAEVVRLNRDLTDIDGLLSSSLHPFKCKYVFEGVGQLIATILIGGAEHLQRINDNGVKKICRDIFSMQQTLCNITSQPEHALNHARQFFELFMHTPDELVDEILEKGPVFKELEYMNALKLLYRSKPGMKSDSLHDHMSRLSNILGDVGVVV